MRAKLRVLPDDQLEILMLSREGYKESRVDDHEVRVKGKMYDVARVETTRDSVRIYCLYDEKEDSLIALCTELIGKPLESGSSLPGAILKFIGLHFIVFEDAMSFTSARFPIAELCGYTFNTCTPDSEIATPPPRSRAAS